jgi:hypothetical protein
VCGKPWQFKTLDSAAAIPNQERLPFLSKFEALFFSQPVSIDLTGYVEKKNDLVPTSSF